jgi:hypothetical protein
MIPYKSPENPPRRHQDTKARSFFNLVPSRLCAFVVTILEFKPRQRILNFASLILTMTIFLNACAPLDASLITATPAQPTETPFMTPTIVWFPPSATPSPAAVASQTPIPDMHPGLGRTILTDTFSDPDDWDTAVSNVASAAITRSRLTLAVQGGGIYLPSFRQGPSFTDFYAEITAKTSLCRDSDSYGLLVRGKAVAYYRFALTCHGQVRADRISVDTRRPLQEPVFSGDAPPGAPGEVRIGVWAAGSEMRLFLNGRYQFSINDSNYASGGLGVFVQSTGDTPVTVTFSDLVVREVDYVPPPAATP